MQQDQSTENFLQRMVAKRDQGGFTLIELLIVIIILAILAAIVVFAVGSTNTNAIASSCNADAKSVETALEAYKAQLTNYPATLDALTTSFPTTVNGVSETVGPWLKEVPSTTNYTISFDSSTGVVSVAAPGGSPVAFTGNTTNPCNAL